MRYYSSSIPMTSIFVVTNEADGFKKAAAQVIAMLDLSETQRIYADRFLDFQLLGYSQGEIVKEYPWFAEMWNCFNGSDIRQLVTVRKWFRGQYCGFTNVSSTFVFHNVNDGRVILMLNPEKMS